MDEIILYRQEPTADINANPPEWWNMNEVSILVCLVLKYLGMPATSMPLERVLLCDAMHSMDYVVESVEVRLSVTRRYSIETAKHIVRLFHHQVATPF